MLPDLIEIVPLTAPVKAEITVPGSKSITNRALILAALAIQFILDGAREALPALVHDVPAPSAQKATAPDFRPGPLAFSSR